MGEVRENVYAEAIGLAGPRLAGQQRVVDRIMAVADAEQAELRAEIERLRIAEARERDLRQISEQACDALREEYATLADGYNAQVGHARKHWLRAEAAEAERDALRAQVEAVRETHVAFMRYEPCDQGVTGCESDVCSEDPATGEFFHSDQPQDQACAECRDEDGGFIDWPCSTIRALSSSEPVTAGPPVHIGGNANAEDCPACVNPPYPFLCTAPAGEVTPPAEQRTCMHRQPISMCGTCGIARPTTEGGQ